MSIALCANTLFVRVYRVQGMFYRTIRMLDSGLKPVFVFDGKPPELKGGEVRTANNTTSIDRAGMHRCLQSLMHPLTHSLLLRTGDCC